MIGRKIWNCTGRSGDVCALEEDEEEEECFQAAFRNLSVVASISQQRLGQFYSTTIQDELIPQEQERPIKEGTMSNLLCLHPLQKLQSDDR